MGTEVDTVQETLTMTMFQTDLLMMSVKEQPCYSTKKLR